MEKKTQTRIPFVKKKTTKNELNVPLTHMDCIVFWTDSNQ